MKKFLAVLLTLCMLMSVITIPVSAAVEVDGKEIEGDDTSYVGVSDGSSLDGWSANGATMSIDSTTINNGKTATAVRYDQTATGAGATSFYMQYATTAAKDISKMQFLVFDLWIDTAETAEIMNNQTFMFEITSSGIADHQELHRQNSFEKMAGSKLHVGWNHLEINLAAFDEATDSCGTNCSHTDRKGSYNATSWKFFRIYNGEGGKFPAGYKYSYMVDNFCFMQKDSNAIYLPDTRIIANNSASGVNFLMQLASENASVDASEMTHLYFDVEVPESVNLTELNAKSFRFEIRDNSLKDGADGELELSSTAGIFVPGGLKHGVNHVEFPLDCFKGVNGVTRKIDWTKIRYIRVHSMGVALKYSNFRFVKEEREAGALYFTNSSINGGGNPQFQTILDTAVDVTKMTHLSFDVYVPDATKLASTSYAFELTSSGTCDKKEAQLNGTLSALCGKELVQGWNSVEIPLTKFADVSGFDAPNDDQVKTVPGANVVQWNAINYLRVHAGISNTFFANVRFTAKADGVTVAAHLLGLGTPNKNTSETMLVSKCDDTDGTWAGGYDKTVTDKSTDGVAVAKSATKDGKDDAAITNMKIAGNFFKTEYRASSRWDIRGYRYITFDLFVKNVSGLSDADFLNSLNAIVFNFEVRTYPNDNSEYTRYGTFKDLTGAELVLGWNEIKIDLSHHFQVSGYYPVVPGRFGAIRIFNAAVSDETLNYPFEMYIDNFAFAKEDANATTVVGAANSSSVWAEKKSYTVPVDLGGIYDITARDTLEFDLDVPEAEVANFNKATAFCIELTSSGNCDHLEISYTGGLKAYLTGGATEFVAGKNHIAIPLKAFTGATKCSGNANTGNKCTAHRTKSDTWYLLNAERGFNPALCNFMRLYTAENVTTNTDASVKVGVSNISFTGTSGYPFKPMPQVPETPDEPGEKTETRHETYTFVSNGFGEANADEFRYLRDATVFGAPNAYANIETGTGARYADKTNKIIYAFPIANYKMATALKLTGMFANQFSAEVAVAPVGASAAELQSLTWVSAFNKGTEKLPKNTSVTISLDAILPTLKTMTGDVTLYVRIGDADTSDGWGGYIAAGSTVTFDVTYEVKTGDTVTTEIGVWQGYLPGSSITAEEWKEWRAATGDALTAKSDELNKKYGGSTGLEVTNFLTNGYLLKGSQANFNPNHVPKWSRLYHDDVGAEYAQVFAYTMDKVGEVVDVEWNAFVSGHLKLQVYVGPKVADVASIPADAAWVTLYDHSVVEGEHANNKYLAETSTQALEGFHKALLEAVKANLSETNNTIYIRQYNPCTKGYGGGVHTFAPQNFIRTAVGLSIRMIGERAEIDLREGGKVTINTDGLSVNHGTECSLDGTPAEVVGTVTNAENITGLTYEYIWMTEANVKLDAAPTKGGRYKVGIRVADNAKGYYGYAELPVFEIAHKYTDDCDDTCDICGERTREAAHDWKILGREAVTPTEENGWASATIHRHCDRCGTDDPNLVISRDPEVALHPEYWTKSIGTIGTAELGDRIGGRGMITLTTNTAAAVGTFRIIVSSATPVDISDMEYLVFDLYVPAEAVKIFNEKNFMLELTSSGTQDKKEDAFDGTMAGLAGKPIVEGWNHIAIPLSSVVGKTDGGLDKTGWNFMRLFNNEAWDSIAPFTIGIANYHFATALESDFRKTTTFKALTDEEKNYLDSSAKGVENSGRDTRYADKTDKFIYKYSLGTGVADLTGIYWSAPTSGQLKLEVGVAAAGGTPATYYPVYTYPVASAGNDKDTGLGVCLRAYDLLAVLKENNVTLADNNVIFIKISDADTATGNGGAVKTRTNVTLALEYKMPTEHDGDMHLVVDAYGENQHWKWCVSCNAVVGEKVDHTLDSPCDPDCNDGCGYVREVAHVTDGDIYDYVGTEHWQLCLKCGERINKGDHIFDNECDATCNLCGFVRNVHHTTDGKWFFDASGHWMVCQDCGSRVDFAAHKYENLCGGTCEICGFVHAIEHTWADEMGMDEHNHWYVCAVCGETDEVTAHVFDNNCDKDCNVCGYVREVEHKFDTKWSSNGAGHYHACVNCGEPDKIIAHTFSNECDEDCDVCGYVRTATHMTSGTWEHDGEDHWKVCTKCGKKVDLAVHVFDNACDADCNICGMTHEVEHTFGEKYVSDEDGHWRVCEKCGTKEAAQAHVFGDGCGTTCDVCGYVRGKVDHVFNGEWTFDENNHWHACSVCGGAIQDSAAHTWNAGKATVGGVTVHTCTVCGAIKTVKADSERPAPDVKPADDTVQLPADIAVVIEDVTSSIADKVVENIENGLKNNKTVIEALGKNAEVISHFDISLVSGGAKVQPGGKVKVTIPASAYEYKNGVDYLVVYVDEDGNITPCETTQHEDGTLEFTTDHFSHYAIVGNTTSGGAPVWVFILIGVVAIAAVAAIVVVTMKKKKAKA